MRKLITGFRSFKHAGYKNDKRSFKVSLFILRKKLKTTVFACVSVDVMYKIINHLLTFFF